MNSKRKAEPEFHQPAKCSRVEEVLTRGNNALMKLNEIGIKGLKWNFEQINAMFPQRFRATCLFTEPFTGLHNVIPSGVVFSVEGSNKLSCRHDIASQIMDRLSDKHAIDKSLPISSVIPLEKEVLINTSNNVKETPRADESVRLLNEKVPDIEYNLSLTDDGFCCLVSYKDTLFKGTGTSKKAAKRTVASQILKTYFNYLFTEDGVFHSPIIDTATNNENYNLPINRRTKFSNQIQAMIKNGYEKLVSALDIQNEKRRVLAGIVISRKLEDVFPEYKTEESRARMPDINDPLQFYTLTGWTVNPDDAGEILKLVTVSSGSKCLSVREVNSPGVYINDSHSEVITKRALQYFIHRTIHRLSNGVHPVTSDPLYGTDILEIYAADNPYTFKLKENVKFHLYVSSSPCGDSRLLFPQTVRNKATLEATNTIGFNDPTRSNLGLLRTKIECGEGTVPIKLNRIETWDRILDSERVSIMSCSDKVCTWNVLGLQGALLSNMLSEPIYLDSITIGSLFQVDHSQRALCDRARNVINYSDWMLNKPINDNVEQNDTDMEQGELKNGSDCDRLFHVNTPYLLTVTDQDERCPGNGSDFSGNWIVGEKSFEILTTANGLTTENCASRLSKRSLFMSFLGIFKWLPIIYPEDGVLYYDELKTSVNYPDHALGAVKYKHKKMALLHYFESQNLGSWIKKSFEQDHFALRI